MITFCPNCSNVLTVNRAKPDDANDGAMRSMQAQLIAEAEKPYQFMCRTCPFVMELPDFGYQETKRFEGKKMEDVIGGDDAWRNVDRTSVKCQNDDCGSSEAYFYQVQIRSADEPMTNFYKCCQCSKEWRE